LTAVIAVERPAFAVMWAVLSELPVEVCELVIEDMVDG